MKENNEDESRRKKLLRDKKDKYEGEEDRWEDRKPPRGRHEEPLEEDEWD